ncbi:MAG: amino acid permease [Anaerolineae bacterium]
MKNKTIRMSRFWGAVLLIAGTTIGAGMLALPVATAFTGFFPSLALFLICWLLMLASAFCFLDVNLFIKGESNLISMAGQTLGRVGKAISWIIYLLLLYSLTAAYIAASAPLFAEAIAYLTGWRIPSWLAPFSLPFFFGSFIYMGTGGVDKINRLLMIGLLLAYALLVAFLPTHIQPPLLTHVDWPVGVIAISVILTSFGYHIIIPSLTTYMEHDAKRLRRIILIGSAIPLLVYIVWQFLILGIVPLRELSIAWQKGASATDPLSRILPESWLTLSARFFSFFAIVTSFLGVALSLSDFLTDGLKIKKTWEGRLMALSLTFLPPLFFVFTYERGFYLALQYAGAFVAILLGILPAAMAWTLKTPPFYRSFKGRVLLIAIMLLSLIVVIIDILQETGCLAGLLQGYTRSS